MSDLFRSLSGPESREAAALLKERDAELRAAGYIRLAAGLESRGKERQAAQIYQHIIAEGGKEAELARRRLEVLQGGGSFGAQVERLSRNFAKQAADPALLLSMGVAGTVASLARFGILSRLAAAPASWGTRGFGARLVAGTGSLALEAPAFTVGTRCFQAWGPSETPPDGTSWKRELASGYLLLGAFRLTGAFHRAATAQWLGAETAGGLNARLLQQGASWTGILGAHLAESRLGLREPRPFGDTAWESLATLLHLHVAGRLSQNLLGPRFSRFHWELQNRGQNLPKLPPRGLALAGTGSSPFLAGPETPAFQAPLQLWMASGPESTGTSSRPFSRAQAKGKGNGMTMLQQAEKIWSDWLQHEAAGKQNLALQKREAGYDGAAQIPAALDEVARSAAGRPVLAVELDLAARPEWADWGRDFLRRNPAMEEILLADARGEGWWVGRPPLGTADQAEALALGDPAFRSRWRNPGLVTGLRLRDRWQSWGETPPIAAYLKELRLAAGLSASEVAARIDASPGMKEELRSYRMSSVTPRHIQYAEAGRRLPVAFPLLRRMAEVYGVDVRRLVLASNRSQYPEIPESLWSTEHYPLYLESQADLGRIRHFQAMREEGKDPVREFSWLLFSARKNPDLYRTIPDIAAAHSLTQTELAAWELGQRSGVPSLQKMAEIATALALPVDRVIHAVNRTYYPDLPLETLFPGQAIYINSKEHDPEYVRAYAERPGSVGQYVFAARKRLEGRPGRSAWSREQGYDPNYLYEREGNRVKILEGNLSDWSELFRRLAIPNDLLRTLAKTHGKILMTAPVHLLAENGRPQELAEQSGLSAGTITSLSRLRHVPRAETIRDLSEAFPDLDAGSLYLRAHPEMSLFFPELDLKKNLSELELGEEQIRRAASFHLGSALFAYRHDGGLGMPAVAERLGVQKQTVSLYESVFVRIQKPEILSGLADLLGLDRRMIYLHYNPEILDIFPRGDAPPGETPAIDSRSFLREANKTYDRSNLRRHLMAAMGRQRLLRNLSSELSPAERVAQALQVSEAEAKKFVGEARILNLEDIRFLMSRLPALDYAQWYGHFHRSSLTYFLGQEPGGNIDYRTPAGLPPRAEGPGELWEGLHEQIVRNGAPLPANQARRLRGAIEQGSRLDTMTLARLAREQGLDRRWLFFHFRRPELAPILGAAPKP